MIAPESWFSKYAAPSVVGGAIAFVVSTSFNAWNAYEKHIDTAHVQAATFSKILTDSVLMNIKPFAKGSTKYDEQQAVVAVMALDSLAQSEDERRTVLSIGAKMLNANPDRADTGGPGARFLDVSIGQLLARTRGGADENDHLLAYVRSPGFVDMAAAGYTTQYYNDDPKIAEIQPTRSGDQPITQEAKAAVLFDVGPETPTAWVHLASWQTNITMRGWNFASVHALMERIARPEQLARTAGDQTMDFAEPWSSGHPSLSPQRLSDWLIYSKSTVLVLTRPRLARANPPIVNYSGGMRTGTLGRVIGAIPAEACVQLVDKPVPILVFLSRIYKSGGAGETKWSGLIHLWGHVRTLGECPL